MIVKTFNPNLSIPALKPKWWNNVYIAKAPGSTKEVYSIAVYSLLADKTVRYMWSWWPFRGSIVETRVLFKPSLFCLQNIETWNMRHGCTQEIPPWAVDNGIYVYILYKLKAPKVVVEYDLSHIITLHMFCPGRPKMVFVPNMLPWLILKVKQGRMESSNSGEVKWQQLFKVK